MATREFYKMSGSGNDFVVFDTRQEKAGALEDPVVIQALCARGTGVGADGLVFLTNADDRARADVRMRYFNSDGNVAAMCGNAALCITRLAADLGAAQGSGMHIQSDMGILASRLVGATPEVDLPPVRDVRSNVYIAKAPGEERIGFCLAGVPHLVVQCADVTSVDVVARGSVLRRDPGQLPDGANIDFVSRRSDGNWSIRTYERGVEAETLACGTGAVAAAILLAKWNASTINTTLITRSERVMHVTLQKKCDEWYPSLRGEGRLVFTGQLADR
ncbi:MAG TPA: diaminopimelate epimerase [Gemmatimonadaceae bacterium]|jgi:diaminopimelate epimerase|nr:diaminopimelate epimerase [Gemmatimonadaceae bacterium]